jgi:hypothetical protein
VAPTVITAIMGHMVLMDLLADKAQMEGMAVMALMEVMGATDSRVSVLYGIAANF